MNVSQYASSQNGGSSQSPNRPNININSRISVLKKGPLQFLFGGDNEKNEQEGSSLVGLFGISGNKRKPKAIVNPIELGKKMSQNSQNDGHTKSTGAPSSSSRDESPESRREAAGKRFKQMIKQSQMEKGHDEAKTNEKMPSLTPLKTEELNEEDRVTYIQLLESSYAAEEL